MWFVNIIMLTSHCFFIKWIFFNNSFSFSSFFLLLQVLSNVSSFFTQLCFKYKKWLSVFEFVYSSTGRQYRICNQCRTRRLNSICYAFCFWNCSLKLNQYYSNQQKNTINSISQPIIQFLQLETSANAFVNNDTSPRFKTLTNDDPFVFQFADRFVFISQFNNVISFVVNVFSFFVFNSFFLFF